MAEDDEFVVEDSVPIYEPPKNTRPPTNDPRVDDVVKIFIEQVSPVLSGGNVTVRQMSQAIVDMFDACNKDG